MSKKSVLNDIDSMFDDDNDVIATTQSSKSTGLGNGLLRATQSQNSTSNDSITINDSDSDNSVQSVEPVKPTTGISTSQQRRRLQKAIEIESSDSDNDPEAALIKHNQQFQQKQKHLQSLEQYRHNNGNNTRKQNGFFKHTQNAVNNSKQRKPDRTHTSNRPTRRTTKKSYNESEDELSDTITDDNASNAADIASSEQSGDSSDEMAQALKLSAQQAKKDRKQRAARLKQVPAAYRAHVVDTSDVDIADSESSGSDTDAIITKHAFQPAKQQQKRKSVKPALQSKYVDPDTDADMSDSDLMSNTVDEDDSVDTSDILDEIEQILGRRVILLDEPKHNNNTNKSTPLKRQHSAEMNEKQTKHSASQYLIKYRERGHIHCEWLTINELSKIDSNYRNKVNAWNRREQKNDLVPHTLLIDPDVNYNPSDTLNHDNCVKVNCIAYGCDDQGEFFDVSHCEVDRIVSSHDVVDEDTGDTVKTRTEYLIKWRNLGYDKLTWELSDIVTDAQVARFLRNTLPPPADELKVASIIAGGNKYCAMKSHDKETYNKTNKPIPPFDNGKSLREYQIEGLNWLIFKYLFSNGCLLADEMGLGKTVQVASYLRYLYQVHKVRGPHLIIAPLSTLPHWQREIEEWTGMNAVIYHGDKKARDEIRKLEFKHDVASSPLEQRKYASIYKFHVLITTDSIFMSDSAILCKIKWSNLVVDEAHRLKNAESKLSQELRYLPCTHTVLMTGTPIQNNLRELYTLLTFCDSNKFASGSDFAEKYGDLLDSNQQTVEQNIALRDMLHTYLLRREKYDVEKSMPAREEIMIEVEMTTAQKTYYKALYDKNYDFLTSKKSKQQANLSSLFMELRKVCQHPYLINGAEDELIDDAQIDEYNHEQYMQLLIETSGKFVLLHKLLPKLQANKHRVLIFSQMTRVLDMIEEYADYCKYDWCRLDGSITGAKRQQAIDKFNAPNSSKFLFLISTKSGGTGLNLQSADTIIIFDSDWNPQNDLQAQARVHRIGQTKEVKVYRLVIKNSYEFSMFHKASLKLGLDRAVLHTSTKEKPSEKSNQLTSAEIERLLKEGAYALMSDDSGSKQFNEADIDTILQRNAKVVKLDASGVQITDEEAEQQRPQNSTFSKASFRASTADGVELDISDPDFWLKVGLNKQNQHKRKTQPATPTRKKSVSSYKENSVADVVSGDDSDASEYKKRDSEASDTDNDDLYLTYTKSQRHYILEGLHTFFYGRFDDMKTYEANLNKLTNEQINVLQVMYLKQLYVSSDDNDGVPYKSDILLPIVRPYIVQALIYTQPNCDVCDSIDHYQLLMKIDVDACLKSTAFIESLGQVNNKLLELTRLAVLNASIEHLRSDKQITSIDDVIIHGLPTTSDDVNTLPAELKRKLQQPVKGAESWWHIDIPNHVDKRVLLAAWLDGKDNTKFILEEKVTGLLTICRPSDREIREYEPTDIIVSLPQWPGHKDVKSRIVLLLRVLEHNYVKRNNLKTTTKSGTINNTKLTDKWSKSELTKVQSTLTHYGLPQEQDWSVNVPAPVLPDVKQEHIIDDDNNPTHSTATIHLQYNWSIFADYAGVKTKTPEQLQQAALTLYRFAQQMRVSSSSTGRQRLIDSEKDSVHNNDVVDNTDLDVDSDVILGNQTSMPSNTDRDIAKYMSEWHNNTANKILERADLMKKLRNALQQDQLQTRIDRFINKYNTPTFLVKYWRPQYDDYALVIGTMRHGFAQWKAMDDDPALSIFKNMPHHNTVKTDIAKSEAVDADNEIDQSTAAVRNNDVNAKAKPFKPTYISESDATKRLKLFIANVNTSLVEYNPTQLQQSRHNETTHDNDMLSTPTKQSTLQFGNTVQSTSSSSSNSNKENTAVTTELTKKPKINLNNLFDAPIQPQQSIENNNKRPFNDTPSHHTAKPIVSPTHQPLQKKPKKQSVTVPDSRYSLFPYLMTDNGSKPSPATDNMQHQPPVQTPTHMPTHIESQFVLFSPVDQQQTVQHSTVPFTPIHTQQPTYNATSNNGHGHSHIQHTPNHSVSSPAYSSMNGVHTNLPIYHRQPSIPADVIALLDDE